MKTCADVEKRIRDEMTNLSINELKQFALGMGITEEELADATRDEIENCCVAIEQYAFVH